VCRYVTGSVSRDTVRKGYMEVGHNGVRVPELFHLCDGLSAVLFHIPAAVSQCVCVFLSLFVAHVCVCVACVCVCVCMLCVCACVCVCVCECVHARTHAHVRVCNFVSESISPIGDYLVINFFSPSE